MSGDSPLPLNERRNEQEAVPAGAGAARRAGEDGGAGRRGVVRDASLSAVLAGLVAVVVSCSGPLVIVLAAADAGRLSPDQTASWVWAACVGSGVTCAALSWWTRMPVITAFSTPGAAVLVGSLGAYPYAEAIGAFLVTGLVMALIGVTGAFGWAMRRVPPGVVAGMLAGVLFSFGAGVFSALDRIPVPVLASVVTYFAVKRRSARYAVACAFLAAVLATAAGPGVDVAVGDIAPAAPLFTAPDFSLQAMVGIAIPLTVVTMASQNAPGLAVLTAFGYRPDDRTLIGVTGLASAALAPFGGHAINLAAITAAICTGEEAHPDPRRRYVAGVACGFFYLVTGVCGAALVGLFTALPADLVAVIAGVALLGAFSTSLAQAVADESGRDAAVVAFLTTASGVTLGGIGSACWGLVLGLATHATLTLRRRARRRSNEGAPDRSTDAELGGGGGGGGGSSDGDGDRSPREAGRGQSGAPPNPISFPSGSS
ncbi:benzoate/H(+) symporter BenE family transporter [Streptomyces phyllanthi]|uniref:benzoate/H(+) symporter BenE family transporter n=1 Tax=Streptomyces phyllanthi TaxID=1803180 RepID=UPI002AD56589|nr:benzoate/H(+) symporter BenE family transporter [Streptomyces phyllanthi]